MRAITLRAILTAAIAALAAGPAAARPATVHYTDTATIPIAAPGSFLIGDIISAEPRTGLVYLGDTSNGTLDVLNGRTHRLLAQAGHFVNGPNGVLVDSRHHVWAADGNGVVHVVQARAPYRTLATVKVGSEADEIGYDARDGIVAVTSPDGGAGHAGPYLTLISARRASNGHYPILAKVRLPGVGKGELEQPQWDPALGSFVASVGKARGAPKGALAVIDPLSRRLTRLIALHDVCHPTGLALGPAGQMLAGCGSGGPELLSALTGAELHRYPGKAHCCADEVAYDALAARWFVAESGSNGPPPAPQLAPPAVIVIDGRTDGVLATIALGSSAGAFHQVTALGARGTAFVPESDGVHVFTAS